MAFLYQRRPVLVAILLVALQGRSWGFVYHNKVLAAAGRQTTATIRTSQAASVRCLVVMPLGAKKPGDDSPSKQTNSVDGQGETKTPNPRKPRKSTKASKAEEDSASDRNVRKGAPAETFAIATETLDQIGNDRRRLELYQKQLRRAFDTSEAAGDITEMLRLNGFVSNVELILERLIARGAPPARTLRVANVDFEISRQELLHDFDFNLFRARVLDLFKWYSSPTVTKTYMAPCFPMVQSSGMGKTKLLWELRKLVDENSDTNFKGCVCKTILCSTPWTVYAIEKEKVYSLVLQLPTAKSEKDRDDLCSELDKILIECKDSSKVILLFDESQHLLTNDGYAFQVVRWWLRLSRKGPEVVAVFTGTTSQLANLYAEPPEYNELSTSRQPGVSLYRRSGTALYDPFWNLCTIGLFAKQSEKRNLIAAKPSLSEYERAIPYGRPLFAMLQQKGQFNANAEFNVLCRMLLSKEQRWSENDKACLSVLGTRLQLGQTSINVASDLVARGYALLSHYVPESDGNDGNACIFFPPDPVCARLAMLLMDEDTEMNCTIVGFRGRNKKFWMSKMSRIFSTGLCVPSNGDLGEVATASYLLFCGDLIRKRIDRNYTTFSVPLSAYVQCLLNPNAFSMQEDPVESTLPIASEECLYRDASVSFIQVTRNYIRFSTSDFHNQEFLRELYESGNALYTYPDFHTFDMVASIKLTSFSNEESYAPLFVSLSTTTDKKTKLSDPQRGLGLKVLFDRSKKGFNKDSTDIVTLADVGRVLNGEGVAKVVFVPKNDPFGVTDMLTETMLCGTAQSEIYASHFRLYNHPVSEVISKKLVRSNSRKQTTTYLDSMRKALLDSREK